MVSLDKDEVLVGENKKLNLKERFLPIENGDVIVFHTDGINSALNTEGEHFDTQDISRILMVYHQISAEALINKLKDSILTFYKGVTLEDDIIIIVLKINDKIKYKNLKIQL